MSLNGEYYDTLLAQIKDLQNHIRQCREDPLGNCVVSKKHDARMVGLMVCKLDNIISRIPDDRLGEWDGNRRAARLWLVSSICRRDISTTWIMQRCEVMGWLKWAITRTDTHIEGKFVKDYPAVRMNADRAMRAYVVDRTFRDLVKALPHPGTGA